MNQDYIKPNAWSIIEEGFDADRVKSSESLFSLGNGAMGQRANFEETYSGSSFQGSYIAGVYYPDKTKVGWWKNGYPEYFAKVLNAPNWIGVDIWVDGEPFDLNTCTQVIGFRRELNMREGWYQRTFKATMPNGAQLSVSVKRFLSLAIEELGAISYTIQVLDGAHKLRLEPYLDGGITNEDSNWDDKFWNQTAMESQGERAFLKANTLKTEFHICSYMANRLWHEGNWISSSPETVLAGERLGHAYELDMEKNESLKLYKFGGYVSDRRYGKKDLISTANRILDTALEMGFDTLLEQQALAWQSIWETADIEIVGDLKAQQGIRFNIFQLNQTYLGNDPKLNIGPKGFTGEKYGGSTYWDTEAYCIPFYMATKNQEVARNLLEYRFKQLPKAIENAEKLGFDGGAALYPMVTMNGEECHNEWEITFEEIHRNGAIAFAIYNYTRYTNDLSYMPEMGLEVLVGIARFWGQRVSFSKAKGQYVMLGVTGPNEYENNVNNNWYTNYLAQWCLLYAKEQLLLVSQNYAEDYERIVKKTKLEEHEPGQWEQIAQKIYFPVSETQGVYLQQDGFLDKELIPVSELDPSQRPINQKWSWDRILRSPYIKQADVLQGFYFFEERFSLEAHKKHFEFYEPFTVHESSLSPCVHSILASRLDKVEQAYAFYLRTSRLDLDDYNKEVEEGLHITSMAGTWMSIVEGFGGMRVKDGMLCFDPKIPANWHSYSFKVNFRGHIITLSKTQDEVSLRNQGQTPLRVRLLGAIMDLPAER
jgi:maltose phosphorylase